MGFLQDYFLQPFLQDAGYNIYNSLVFFTLLALLLIFVIPALLRRWDIQLNPPFIQGVVAYALLGSIARSAEDLHILQSDLFVSPVIWVVGLGVGTITYFISRYAERVTGWPYQWTWSAFAGIGGIALLLQFPFPHLNRLGIITLSVLPWLIPLAILFYQRQWLFAHSLITFPLAAHLLDASITFASIQYFGYSEKHVLPSYLIQQFGPAVMFPLKLAVILPVSVIIYRQFPEERRYLLTVIGLIGLITAVRNIVTLLNAAGS